MRRWRALLLLLLAAAALVAQRGRFAERDSDDAEMPAKAADFHFLRLEYTDVPQHRRGWGFSSRSGQGSGWWIVDWPAADNHFTTGVERLTRIDVGDPRHVRLTDDRIFDYPWIYATQAGWWGYRMWKPGVYENIYCAAGIWWWMISGDRTQPNGKCSAKP